MNWDGLVAFLLVYTAIVTPYEVAFLESEIGTFSGLALFAFNRFVDLVFMLDIIKEFCSPYFDNMQQYWITDQRLIAKRYLYSWFPIDFVSVLPFDTVGVIANSEEVKKMKAARIIRLARLLKLLRLLKSMRIINRWQDEIGMLHIQKTMLSFFFLVFAVAHWTACAWRMTPDLDLAVDTNTGEQLSWLDDFNTSGAPVRAQSPFTQYAVAFYWASMTLSTIGYGNCLL